MRRAVAEIWGKMFKLGLPISAPKLFGLEGIIHEESGVDKPPKGTSLDQTESIDVLYVGVERLVTTLRVPEDQREK